MSVDVRTACFMTKRFLYYTAYSRVFLISTAQATTVFVDGGLLWNCQEQ